MIHFVNIFTASGADLPSFNAFNKLDAITRVAIADRVLFRENRYLAMQAGEWKPAGEILLVGDRPAPSAPDDPTFHYTPFSALWNSSLWLNLQLHRFQIPEAALAWVNAADLQGIATDPQVLSNRWSQIIALGGNAGRWLMQNAVTHHRVMHPQAWKRFHAKEPYPLLGYLDLAT